MERVLRLPRVYGALTVFSYLTISPRCPGARADPTDPPHPLLQP